MDIKDTEEKITALDSLLTSIEKLLKKHYKILILGLLIYGLYFLFTVPFEDEITHKKTTLKEITEEVVVEDAEKVLENEPVKIHFTQQTPTEEIID